MNKRKSAPIILLLCVLLSALGLPAAQAAQVKLNASPVAENMELTTYRGVCVSGTFKCIDPEGDAVTYSVTREPVKGTVTVDGDTFVYTPTEGKKGSDSFSYVATDTAGNVSNTAVVNIKIKKQKTAVTYRDLAGSPEEYAAVALAERGIFTGENVGGDYLFRPDAPVTRGEFLVMCMKLTGAPLLEGITRTGFYDDGEIPMWQKPYVTTALMDQVISGTADPGGRILFRAGDQVTFAEAAVILSNCLDITDVDVEETSAPAWASQAAANLTSCDILPSVGAVASAACLTRADAAQMLLRAALVLDNRQGDGLLGWAK